MRKNRLDNRISKNIVFGCRNPDRRNVRAHANSIFALAIHTPAGTASSHQWMGWRMNGGEYFIVKLDSSLIDTT